MSFFSETNGNKTNPYGPYAAAMNSESTITVSIVSHGDASKVEHLLESLRKHEPDPKRFQIILTDNWGNDLPEFDPARWGSLNILRNRASQGFARNHNNAFKLAQGRYFAILNPDLVFERPIFDKLLDRLKTHQSAIVAPYIVDTNGTIQDSFRTLPTPLEIVRRRLPGYKFEPFHPDRDGLIHPDWTAGMFWLMRSDVFRALGGMDERYRLYFEDVDFCTRARLKGIEILVDASVQIRHDAQRSSRKKLYYLLLHSQSALRFFASPVYRQAQTNFRHSE